MLIVLQGAVTMIWAVLLTIHVRRLLRLSAQPGVTQHVRRRVQRQVRRRLERMWWWLGREEFWRTIHLDCLRSVQITLMIFAFGWGLM